MRLSPTEQRLYDILLRKAGNIVPTAEFADVMSAKKGTANLRVVMCRLRRRGLQIETVFGVGYRLRAKKKMPVIVNDIEAQMYADDIQSAMQEAMRRHAESVGFEAQIAIIGVALGALLDQLPDHDREHFSKILFRNVRESRKYSKPMRMQ